jgi:hypothetical protein
MDIPAAISSTPPAMIQRRSSPVKGSVERAGLAEVEGATLEVEGDVVLGLEVSLDGPVPLLGFGAVWL